MENFALFNPPSIHVSLREGRWTMVEANRELFDFDNDINEVKKSLDLIGKYHLSRACCKGRPDPIFSYLRQ
jgi:hypothetical protein